MSHPVKARAVFPAALLCLALLAIAFEARAEKVPPTIAIIIDDMGHNAELGERLARMDYPLTLAFLPYRRHTDRLARLAHQHNKEIMLHAPMANTVGFGLGAGGLAPDMDQRQLTRTLRHSLRSVPHVSGLNNHMGSLLTQLRPQMEWLMREIRRYPLYFVDSRTIASTLAGETAEAYRIPALTRDVFLDHQQTEAFIHSQFQKLIDIAKTRGSAIAIAHPHPVTVRYLGKALPALDQQGVGLATVSALWRLRHDNRPLFQARREAVQPHLAQTADAD